MEGNECYKYRTLQRFLNETNSPQIQSIIEIGANIGDVTLELARCFPNARVAAYEVIDDYARIAREKTAHLTNVQIIRGAVTYEHIFADDLGREKRDTRVDLQAFLGLPTGGPGYVGGSFISMRNSQRGPDYQPLEDTFPCMTLEDVSRDMFDQSGLETIDYIKSDCEGSECSIFGAAPSEALAHVRYIAGEYHDLTRYWPVARKLMASHYVNLIGDATYGAFFCERHTTGQSLLKKKPIDAQVYGHLHSVPLFWHSFDERWILPEERLMHGLT